MKYKLYSKKYLVELSSVQFYQNKNQYQNIKDIFNSTLTNETLNLPLNLRECRQILRLFHEREKRIDKYYDMCILKY